MSWDGERVLINAQDQGHHTNAFEKMPRLSLSDKCRFCGVETESTSHLVPECKNIPSEMGNPPPLNEKGHTYSR